MTPGSEARPEETDMELIKRWKAGDGRAATRLVGRHSRALARFAASADHVSEYGALDSMIAEEAQDKVRKSLEALSPTQREVFTLRVQQGLSYREIAKVVGSTEGAARVHYHNAIQTVKEFLRDE